MTNSVRKVKTTAASCSAVLDGTSFTHQKFSLIASTIYFGSYVEQAKEGVGLDVSCCPAHIVQLLFNKVKEKKHWVIPRSVFCVSISYTDRHCYTELEFALTLEWRRRDRSACPSLSYQIIQCTNMGCSSLDCDARIAVFVSAASKAKLTTGDLVLSARHKSLSHGIVGVNRSGKV